MQMLNRKAIRNIGCSGTALCFLAIPAQSASLDHYFSGDRNSCYQRVYTAAHLKRHPDQTVRSIEFKHFPNLWGTTGEDGKVRFDEQTRQVYFSIAVRFRGSAGLFEESGECSRENGVLRCGIECDGGGFELKARKDGRLLLKTGSWGFRVVGAGGGCGEDDANMRQITRKTDDRAFLLSRLPDLSCVAPKRHEGN